MTDTYEVHALSAGRWFIDGVYDRSGRDEADEHARSLYAEPHVADVKVIRDTFCADTNRAFEEVVFDAARDRSKTAPRRRPPPGREGAPAGPLAGHRTNSDASMSGLGKKNATENNLRALMIHAAAEIFAKEKDVSRLLTKGEVENIVKRVLSAQELNPTLDEISYALAGATELAANNRDYIESIVALWTHGHVSLNNEDFNKVGKILENTLDDFTNRRIPAAE